MKTNQEKFVPTLPLITGTATKKTDIGVFRKIIGQKEGIKKLSFYVDFSSEKTPVPTFLFTGSQGLGKSFMARQLALSMGRELVEINCSTIQTSKDLIEGVFMEKVMGDTPKVLLLDEAHKLSSEVTTTLLTLLNPNSEGKNRLSYKQWIIEYDFSKITTVLATTDAHLVFRPLINRCEEIYFYLYDNKELFKILKHYVPGIKFECDLNDIAYACRGRARDAFLLSQNLNRYCTKKDINVLTQEDWEKIKDIFGIYTYGLNKKEIGLLSVIGENGPISCSNIAVKLGVNVSNVESELEIRPRELGLIENGARGRVLTKNGEEYISGTVIL